MYTTVERRSINRERLQETSRRAQSEFFPHLQRAQGFVGFYLVADDANSVNTAVLVFDDKAHADAFLQSQVSQTWVRGLDELGHTLLTDNRGDTVVQVEPPK